MKSAVNKPGVSGSTATRRRLTGSERRASILDAAARVFAERGFEAARIEEIATAAGVSKALIYEHFPGKRELYAEIVSRGTEEALGRVASVAAPGVAGVDLLAATLGTFLDFVAERPDVWRVITRQVSDSTIIALEESMHMQVVNAIADLIEADRAVREHPGERAEVEQVAEMINGATLAVVNWWLEHPRVERDLIAENLMSFLWLGLERTRTGQRLGGASAHGVNIPVE